MKIISVHNRHRLSNGENIVVEATSWMLTQKDYEVFVFERNSQNVSQKRNSVFQIGEYHFEIITNELMHNHGI